MNMTIVGILMAVAALWLFIPRSDKQKRASRAKQRKEGRISAVAARRERPFQAVSVLSLGGGCPAVESLGQRRFLVRESPLLPLQECTSRHCNCKYARHDDRRYDGRGRRLSTGVAADSDGFSDLHERRVEGMRGRRKTDIAA